MGGLTWNKQGEKRGLENNCYMNLEETVKKIFF